MADYSHLAAAVAFGSAFLISWALTALLIRLSPRVGLVDHPSDRKLHRHVTPKGGGLAVYAALVAATGVLATQGLVETRWVSFLGVAALVVLLGLLDDLFSLSWQVRLAVQAGATFLALGWPVQNGWLPPALAVVWVVGLLNAFNMLDNMDALSAGVAWVTALLSAALIVLAGGGSVGPAALPYVMLAGALFGFLCFNRPPARIYLGDAGSTLIGFFFGVRSLQDRFALPSDAVSWAVPVGLLAVPWYDLTTVVLIRLGQGRSPFHADRQHLSHRLTDAGLSTTAAVAVIILLALASGIASVLIAQTQGFTAGVALAVLVLGWMTVAATDYALRHRPAPKADEPINEAKGELRRGSKS